MRSILRTAWCSVKRCVGYRPYLYPLHLSAVPEEFLSPPSLSSAPCKGYTFLVVCPCTWGHMAPGRILSHGTESRMERFHTSLDAHALGTLVCPQCGTPSVITISTGSTPKSSPWSASNVPPLPAAVGLSFRPILTCSATCTKLYRVGCVPCPSTAEGEGYVHEGTDRRTGSV